jgi:RNA polymerase sigma-70 factor (ECF subfamily)
MKGGDMGLSDRLLVRRLRRRDHRAARELIARYHAGLYAYLRRLGADRPFAEDLLQETYAKAWLNLASLRNGASLKAWLYAIARNEFLQAVRIRRLRTIDCDEVPDRPDQSPGPLERLEHSRRDQALLLGIERLEPSLREIVVLHYFEDLSLREIAVVCDLAAGTVKSRLNRALSLLRDHMNEKEPDHVGPRTSPTGAR